MHPIDIVETLTRPCGAGGTNVLDITSFGEMPHTWWGPFAVWDGGLGIWGGIAGGAAVGIWRVYKAEVSVPDFMDCVAPALLVAQSIGRIGNYFNQELFGGPSNLPWALQIAPAHRPRPTARRARPVRRRPCSGGSRRRSEVPPARARRLGGRSRPRRPRRPSGRASAALRPARSARGSGRGTRP